MQDTKIRTYSQANVDLVLDNVDKAYILSFKDIPVEEKPREKLIKFGSETLSVGELLAVMLTVGTKKEDVLSMSNRLLKEYGEKTLINFTEPKKLQKALNIPLIKACQIVACFELGRRFFKSAAGKPKFIRTAKQVYELVNDMRNLPKEHLRGIYLNSHYAIVHDEVISIGSLTANIIHPREVFKPAVDFSASAVILVHNHPSGITAPSSEDITITEQLIEAGKILGIHLLDHIIVAKSGFVSVPAHYN